MLVGVRIIAGRFGSRRLAAPAGDATRPTSDRLREALFNVLAPRIDRAAFLDLYAGSGAVGLEALSRGAASVVFVERAPAALKVLRANLAQLRLDQGFRVVSGDVRSFLRRALVEAPQPFELIFLDPPYRNEEEYASTLGALGEGAAGLVAGGGLVVAEHRRKQPLDSAYGCLRRVRVLEQGDAALSFYSREMS